MSQRCNRANRRIAVRRRPKPSTAVVCVATQNGTRRQIGVALLDLSLVGAQLTVTSPLTPGSSVDVGLGATAENRTPLRPATVVWCESFGDGGYRVGTQFQRALSRDILQIFCPPATRAARSSTLSEPEALS